MSLAAHSLAAGLSYQRTSDLNNPYVDEIDISGAKQSIAAAIRQNALVRAGSCVESTAEANF